MNNEEKMPKKKLFIILAAIVVVIAVAVTLVICGLQDKKPQQGTEAESNVSESEQAGDNTEKGPVKVILEKPEDVTIEGLKEEYEIGEEVAFTAALSDEYSVISKVKINGDKVQPDAEGYYRATVTNRLYIIIETELAYGDAVITLEESISHMSYEGVTMVFTLQAEEGAEQTKITGTVKNGQLALKKAAIGTWEIAPVAFFGGELKFNPITLSERENQVTTKRAVGVNDTIKSGSVVVDVAASSVSIKNCDSDKNGNILLQGQKLTGDVWFGMKVQMSTEDLNATDYRNIGINIYKNGSTRVQILSLGNGRAAIKYDNNNVKELSTGLVNALEAGKLLVAVHRTSDGKLEVYSGANASDMTMLFTVDSTNMKTDTLDQFGLDMKGPMKEAAIKNLTSGSSMKAVLEAAEAVKQDVTIHVTSSSKSVSFEGMKFTFTLARDEKVQYTGTVANGKIVLKGIPVGNYHVSSVDFLGGTLSFEDAIVLSGVTEAEITHKERINDTVKNDAVVVDVAGSSISVNNLETAKSSNILLQGQKLTGDVWFGMKVQMSEEDLNATDYRNIGINIYKNGSNRIQVVSLGNGRAAIKYDSNNQKELSSGYVTALKSGELLLAVRRTLDGKLEVYAGVHSANMTKLFTVDSPNMKADTLDQFGLDIMGPMHEAAIEKLTCGDSMTAVLGVSETVYQDVTIKVTGASESMSFEGTELTFTLARDTGVQFTGIVKDGKIAFKQIPNGNYIVSSVNLFGGTLTFEEAIILAGSKEVEITHKEGINDTILSDSVAVDVNSSSVSVKDYENNKSSNIFLQGQNLTGEVWFGMKVQMSEEDLNATDYRNIGINIYKNGSNRIQVVSLGSGRAAVKYDNDNVKEVSSDMAKALSSGGILVALHRTEGGALEVYAGVHSKEMTKLFTVAAPNMGADALDQFGLDIQGPMKEAAIKNLISGESMDEVLSVSDGANQNVTVAVNGKSDNMSFEGVEFTFTLARDTSVSYIGTVDENGNIALENIPLGTYTISDVDFFGGTLTFSDVLIWEGRTEVEITHKEGVNDKIGGALAQINVANSSVSFTDSTATTNRGDGYFFLQGQALKGDVWFGMNVKMSEASLTGNSGAFVSLCIYESGWNLIQVVSAGDGTAKVQFNYNYAVTLSDDILTALKGDGMLLAANRAADGTLKVYGGAKAEEMVLLITVTEESSVKTNMGTADLDQFGFMTQGSIPSAGIENLVSGTSADSVVSGFALAKEDVTVSIMGKSTRMSFEGVELTFTLKSDTSVTYSGTADANGQIALDDMLRGTYSVSSIDFFGGKLTFPDVVVSKEATAVEIEHNEGIQDDITADANTVRVDVATSSVYVTNYTGTDRNSGAFYLKNQTLSGEVWFGMRLKFSSTDWTEKDGYPYIAWNSYVGNNWNFVQVQNNNGNGIGAIKYNNNYVTGLNADLAAALTGDEGMLMLLHRTADGTMEVYLSTKADASNMTKMFTVNATAATGKPALNLGTKTLENFGFLIRGMTGGNAAPDIKSASIENMTSGTTMDEVLSKFSASTETAQLLAEADETQSGNSTSVEPLMMGTGISLAVIPFLFTKRRRRCH